MEKENITKDKQKKLRVLYDNLTVEPGYPSVGMDTLELLCMNIFIILNKTLKGSWLNTGNLKALCHVSLPFCEMYPALFLFQGGFMHFFGKSASLEELFNSSWKSSFLPHRVFLAIFDPQLIKT